MSGTIGERLRLAVATDPVDDILALGAEALQTSAFAEALDPVRQALERFPQHPHLLYLLGLIERSLDRHGPALEALTSASKLLPNDPGIANARACVAFEGGKSAVDLFKKARRLAPDDRSLDGNYAAALLEEGKRAAAIAALRKRLRVDPLWLEGHKALARVRWTGGEREAFADSFEAALKTAPHDPAVWLAYIETLQHEETSEAALNVISRARGMGIAPRALDGLEASMRVERGDLHRAGQLFSGLAPLEFKHIPAYLRFLLRSGNIEEAARIATHIAPQDPTHQIWPYVSMTSRLLGDGRWEWLEGDPSFVQVADIAGALPPLEELADALRELHGSRQHPLFQSLRGGTQTDGHLFQRIDPLIGELRVAVENAVADYAGQLPPHDPAHPLLGPPRSPIAFAGSWSVRLTGGGRHVEHVHPRGWISSALYISLPEEISRGADQAGWLKLGSYSGLGLDLPPIRTVEPRPGRLVLFPSTMWHGTEPFEKGERLTVAFDVARQR